MTMKKSNKPNFRAMIKMYRAEYKLSQPAFAKLIEITPGYVSNIESGIKKPGKELVDKIMKVLCAPPPGFQITEVEPEPVAPTQRNGCTAEPDPLRIAENIIVELVDTIKFMKLTIVLDKNIQGRSIDLQQFLAVQQADRMIERHSK